LLLNGLAPDPEDSQNPTLPPGATMLAGPPEKPLLPNFGDYELVEEIARGGMGIVYKARQKSLGRVVALKMILAGQLAGEAEVQRFHTEARTAANLQHPNIVAIHEVGQHQGQHYFSMDFVEGRSLAEMVQEHPLPPSQAARYVRIIAEAIHYAHQQGTLHRDLKPANVLVDPFDQPRITDFGLAKCLGPSARLTASGAVMGTPAYMPPEQASAKADQLGPPSDVYSLGAVLYELVTGRPPFQAATPLETLRQVLEEEPAAPRLLNPSVGRDLETIILKCLAKEPNRRYATAQELADDLQAFLEGRSIKARRPSLAERVIRWVGKQRRSVLLSAATAAASVVLIAGGVLAWQWYSKWRQGQVMLTTDGLALEAEVLDEHGEPTMPAFTVPTRQPVSLLAGTHRLRILGPRRFSETYHLLVEQGLQRNFEFGPNERQLWEPLEVTKGYEIVDLDGRSDVIQVTEKGLRRLHGATGKPIWDQIVKVKIHDPPPVGDFDWQGWRQEWRQRTHIWDTPYQPWLVRPAPDLDGDGTRYLVWAGRGPELSRPGITGIPWLLAVSAKTGAVKWSSRSQAFRGRGGAMCPPIATDVDGDGKPDLIAVFAPYDGDGDTWAEAISGKTGRSIWRHPFGRQPLIGQERRYAATVTQVGNKRVLVIVAGRRLVGLDVQTGKEVWPVRDLGFDPASQPLFVDLFGKGELAVLLMSESPRMERSLTALSAAAAKTLWQTAVQGGLGRPVVADLDGDGKPEIIVTHKGGNFDPWDRRSRGWVVVEVLDGATGQSRWRRRLSSGSGGPLTTPFGQSESPHLLAGPDLDGDGHRDIFSAALLYDREASTRGGVTWLLVEANSGANGRTFWRYFQPVSKGLDQNSHLGEARLSSLRFGQAGPDGQPQLLVSYTYLPLSFGLPRTIDPVVNTLVFSSTSGKVEHSWPGLVDVDTADFNGDGIPDLYGLRVEETSVSGRYASKLHAVRGGPPERWRRLGAWLPEKKPFDRARSWEGASVAYVALPHADLDGDGIPDQLVFSPGVGTHGHGWSTAELAQEGIVDASLRAYSGKDGTKLWQANPNDLRGDTGGWNISLCSLLECRDLDGDGRPEVLCIYGLGPGSPQAWWLAVLSGRTGKLLWKEKLGPVEAMSVAPAILHLDRAGIVALVVWELRPNITGAPPVGCELRVLNGRDGRLLWRQALPLATVSAKIISVGGKPNQAGSGTIVVAAALHPSGTPDMHNVYRTKVQVFAFDCKDGQPKWTWLGPDNVHAYYPVLADLDGDGRRALCLLAVHGEKYEFINGETRRKAQPQIFQLDQEGRLRRNLTFKPIWLEKMHVPDQPPLPQAEEKIGFGLWSHDIMADGKEKLVFIAGDKVQVVDGKFDKPLWEWPLPGGVGEILDIHPAGKGRPAVVVVRSGNAAYGLDGATGRLRWRCDGPGRPVACLAAESAAALPTVWFHTSKPESTICRQALSVGLDGKYRLPAAPFIDPPAEDVGLIVLLPWINRARQRLPQAILPAVLCLVLLAYLVRKRKRRLAIALLVCLVVIPMGIAGLQLAQDFKFEEQRYTWKDWYLIWPYVFSAGGEWTPKVLLACLVAWLMWRVGRPMLRKVKRAAAPAVNH
jgi:outer membrane protein assembly factor BamB/tRNA A-37 threonylcarbamoyl transferase component Bud32